MNALYPTSTYRHNSGGEPSEIIDLTHGEFLKFHEMFYHPTNAMFFS